MSNIYLLRGDAIFIYSLSKVNRIGFGSVINVIFFSQNKKVDFESVHFLLYFMQSNLPVMVGDNQNTRK